jgi:glycosyltransferase involved in cell wall biosynthesis
VTLDLTVIVPARNEEDCLGTCLQSLTGQSDDGWQLGRDWELIVVDDGSSDRTAEIARSFHGVTVLQSTAPPKGWTGKANAAWLGAKQAQGTWLLFTDADTIHEPGDLRRALHEAEKHHDAMLSYSPRQLVSGFWQRALMPLVFSELALAYPPAKSAILNRAWQLQTASS